MGTEPGLRRTMKTSTTTVYLYVSHMGSMAHTLFAIPIDPCNFNYNNITSTCCGNKQQNENKNGSIESDNDSGGLLKIEPIIEFPRSEYPQEMACAKLGSKLYFLGGERFPLDHPDNRATHIYPPDVYVFDEDIYQSQCKAVIRKLEVGMTSGKPKPLAFTADGKLFILGSCGGPNLISYMSVWPTHLPSSSFRFFEVYDPTTNEWTVLDDPPVTTPTLWVSSPIFIDRQVYLYGQFLGRPGFGVLVCFDLDSYQWVVDPVERSKDVQLHRHRPGRILIGDTYYGLAPHGTGVVRQSLAQEEEEEDDHDQLLFRLPRDLGNLSSRGFCHLWDRHFCTVVTGSLPDPHLPLHIGMLDQRRRYFSVFVFRELPSQDGSPSSEELYSVHYLFRSSYSSFGTLRGCYPCHTTHHARRGSTSEEQIDSKAK